MKIIVLNGSPKGETSVTMQYVHYVQKQFPQHELEIVSIAQRIRQIERDAAAFQAIIEKVRDAFNGRIQEGMIAPYQRVLHDE